MTPVWVDAGFDDVTYMEEIMAEMLDQDLENAQAAGKTELAIRIQEKMNQIEQKIILKKINELESIRDRISQAARKMPASARETRFDEWTLADVLAHISGWDEYTVKTIKSWKEGQVPEWGGDVDEFNQKSVSSRKSMSWEELVVELESTGKALIESYRNLALEDWERPIWPDQPEFTPRRFLEDDLAHYRDEHLSQIENCIVK